MSIGPKSLAQAWPAGVIKLGLAQDFWAKPGGLPMSSYNYDVVEGTVLIGDLLRN
jgi:hypothetical protein